MGCDEHLYVEVRTTEGWKAVDPPKPEGLGEDDDAFWSHWGRSWGYRDSEDTDPLVEWNFGRTYRGYARLAGVRNYNDVTPIAPNRGLPEDVTAEVRACHAGWTVDAHSTTWFTLPEIAGEDDRIGELAAEMRRVATEHGVSEQDVRAVVWFDN